MCVGWWWWCGDALQFDVKIIFQCLSLDNILLMISALLNERKLILTSVHISTLTPVAEALRCLCFPFQWQYPCMYGGRRSGQRLLSANGLMDRLIGGAVCGAACGA